MFMNRAGFLSHPIPTVNERWELELLSAQRQEEQQAQTWAEHLHAVAGYVSLVNEEEETWVI